MESSCDPLAGRRGAHEEVYLRESVTLNAYCVKTAPLSNSKAPRNRFNTTVFASTILAIVLSSLPTPATALTAGEVADNMDARQRNAWVFGAVDMAVHLYRRMGDNERANCIVEWVGGTENTREIDETLRANPALQAAAVIDVLIARHCAPKP